MGQHEKVFRFHEFLLFLGAGKNRLLFGALMECVEKSAEYRKLGRALIRKMPHLEIIKDAGIRIGYCVSDKVKKKGEMSVLGECKLVPPAFKAFIPYDFIIVMYEMNLIGLTDNQKKMVLYHELLHVGIRDSDAEPTYRVNPHDIEDFREILEKHGLNWAEEGADVPDITEGA